MTKDTLRIVYMGTPEFAVAPLRSLVENHYQVVAVITMPDKASGRGMRVQESPVKQYAVSQGIPVLQPEKLKDEAFLEELRSYRADLQIVVAFRMLPEVVWNMPPMGTFNLHASLLPQYRGAAPIHWAVINGEKETGVTTFLLKHEIDTGDLLMQERIAIAPDEETGSVHDRLMELGAALVPQTVDLLLSGQYRAVPQEEIAGKEELKPAPKLFKDNTKIQWNRPAAGLCDFVRGLSPYPAAWSEWEIQIGEKAPVLQSFKLFKAEAEPFADEHPLPGSVRTDGKRYIKVAAEDAWIRFVRLQPAGKKAMAVDEYLRGFQQTPCFRFPADI